MHTQIKILDATNLFRRCGLGVHRSVTINANADEALASEAARHEAERYADCTEQHAHWAYDAGHAHRLGASIVVDDRPF